MERKIKEREMRGIVALFRRLLKDHAEEWSTCERG